jgi:hypothetical protein
VSTDRHETFIQPSRGCHARVKAIREDVGANHPLPEASLLSLVTALIGMLLGFGGLKELFVRGILYRELQPLLVGATGALVGALLLLAALAHWRRWSLWPRLAIASGSASVMFHLYASMPPERNVGVLAMLLGVGIGIALIVRASRERAPLELVKR